MVVKVVEILYDGSVACLAGTGGRDEMRRDETRVFVSAAFEDRL